MLTSPFRSDVVDGKVALVTGGTSGIGLEIARQLGLHGCKVVITGRRQKVLDDATKFLEGEHITVVGLQGDVRQESNCEKWVQQTVQQLGRLDILVNCAAGNFLANAEQLTQKGFSTVMEIDAVGAFTMSRSAFPALKASGDGLIVNISSTLQCPATWYQVHASAAKAAIDSITRSLALEWGEHQIRVNAVAPGAIQGTAGMEKLGLGAGENAADKIRSEIPLGRMGDKWDIAMACVYMASSAGRYISGDVLVVDGAAVMYRKPIIPRDMVSKLSRSVESKSRQIGTAAAQQQQPAARSRL